MRIGLNIMPGAPGGLEAFVEQVKAAEKAGFQDVWSPQIMAYDAMMAFALAAQETSTIEFGTAVVPSYPRHPSVMAQQALTVAEASKGRFNLGIGLSHQLVIEDMLGYSYDKPARHMREYLQALMPLLRGEAAAFQGDQIKNNWPYEFADATPTPVPCLVAALGPVMLKLTGELADGTITWMTGTNTIRDHIVPTISAAASEAGKAAPKIVSGFPICLTDDVEGAKAMISEVLVIYGQLPSYRAMLDREGAAGPADVAILGDEKALEEGIARARDAGVTHFNAAIIPHGEGAEARTTEFLASQL